MVSEYVRGLSSTNLIAIFQPKTLSEGVSSLRLDPPPEPEVREPKRKGPLKSAGYARTIHWGLFLELAGDLECQRLSCPTP